MTIARRLIVTADDYGLCPPANQAIEECLEAGALRATCVMTNMPDAAAALALRRRFPGASLGIHWTLSLGSPLLPPRQVASLVGPDGRFLPFGELRKRLLTGRYDPNQLRAELTAQYERFRELAGEPDFWNTHQNVHVAPGVFELCVALARRLGIQMMRSHRRVTVPKGGGAALYYARHPVYWLKGQLIARWTSRVERGGMALPEGIVYLPGYGAGRVAIEEVVALMPWAKLRRAVEWVIHPAVTAQHPLFGRLTESRLREYEVFRDPGLKERLARRGVEVVGFETLRSAGVAA
jgi:chitin disaccharide deacetylase